MCLNSMISQSATGKGQKDAALSGKPKGSGPFSGKMLSNYRASKDPYGVDPYTEGRDIDLIKYKTPGVRKSHTRYAIGSVERRRGEKNVDSSVSEVRKQGSLANRGTNTGEAATILGKRRDDEETQKSTLLGG